MKTAKFKLYTGALKAYEETASDGTTRKKFRTTASSTIKDLAGDEITHAAIEKMAEQARNGMTIFLNHSYNVPEDVLGSVEDAQVIVRGTDEHGNPLVDLDLDVVAWDSNPRAAQAWDAINSGVRLGTSIGAIVKHAAKKKGGGHVINDVKLLEASIVGIPANPRSWVHYAMRSLAAVDADTVIDEETEVDFDEADISVVPPSTDGSGDGDSDGDVAKSVDGDDSAVVSDGDVSGADSTDSSDDDSASTEVLTDNSAEIAVSAEPDKEAARTRVTVTVDSDEAQKAPRSSAENASGIADETAPGDDAALGDNATKTGLVELVKDLTDKVAAAASQEAALREELATVVAERDEAVKQVETAKQLIERISKLPLRRKTYPLGDEEAPSPYEKYAGLLDPQVIKLMERHRNG